MSSTVNQIGTFEAGRAKPTTALRPLHLPELGSILTVLAAFLLIAGFSIVAKPLVVNDLPLLLGNGASATSITS